jgi:glycolate oxidase FAD binding subunit
VHADLGGLQGRLENIVGAEYVSADPEVTARFAVDGVKPGLTVRPGTQNEVSKVAATCSAAGATMIPWGGGTAMGLGNRPSSADAVVQLDRLDRIVEFDAANLCVTVEAGMRLGALRETVAEKKELLPIDPPADSKVTMGGLVATNQSGPGRLLYGTVRDWLLGMRVVLPDGQRIRCGGRVIKNVSGYDMNKLFIRSLGTLGILTEVTVKLLPLPVKRTAMVSLFPELSQATAAVGKVLESFLLPEALDVLNPEAMTLLAPSLELTAPAGSWGLAVSLAGSRETVDRQERDFAALFRDGGGVVTPLQDGRTVPAWDAIRNVFDLLPAPPAQRVLCKIAVSISRTGEMLAAAGALGERLGLSATVVAHAGSGVVWAAFPLGRTAPPEALLAEALEGLRAKAVATGGSLVLQAAPANLKARMDAWGKPGEGFDVMRRLKAEFDPRGLCNPGRFVGGI